MVGYRGVSTAGISIDRGTYSQGFSLKALNLGESTVAEEWMAVKLRRPILVGGVGLSFSLWVLQSLHHSLIQLGELGLLGAIALGGGLWLFQQRASQKAQLQLDRSPLDRATVEKEIALAEGIVSQLEAENHQALEQLRERVVQLKAELDRQEILVAVTGGKAVGKTTLIHQLEYSWVPQLQQPLCLRETPALFTGTGCW